ncbi:MAG: putative RNA uridine N3 methyltransferase [Nitrososphaerales archaeon]
MVDSELWVAMPDSLVSDSSHLREKTSKLGMIGRACSIFGVSKIYIYKDLSGNYEEDGEIMKTILEYMETPQYLRKRIFKQSKALTYAGLLPPLRTPHHKLEIPLSDVKVGDLREGVAIKSGDRMLVDVGLSSLIPLDGRAEEGERLTVIFTSKHPDLKCRVAKKDEIKDYWGYKVKKVPSLGKLVKSVKTDMTIFTSRKGRMITEVWLELINEVKRANSILIVFGSPKRGVFEILSDEKINPMQISKFTINVIPDQKTATVRTEEALFVSLAILNLAIHL